MTENVLPPRLGRASSAAQRARQAGNILWKEDDMAFWKLGSLQLEEFRPGIMSKAEIGDNLIMVCMQISKGKEDTGHEHSFDQCGIVLEGQIVKKKGSQQLTKGVYQSLWEKKQENKIDSGSVEY